MTNLIVRVLRGISGSGKSTYIAKHFPDFRVCSADLFFAKPDGTCVIDVSKLGDAHGWCQRQYAQLVVNGGADKIVVDNTNITIAEMGLYVSLGMAFGGDVEIITLDVPREVAGIRNIHGTPDHVLDRMQESLVSQGAFIPPWWKHTVVKP